MKTISKKHILISCILVALISVAAFCGLFYSADHLMRDQLYNRKNGTSPDIVIIGVDEETLDRYGDFTVWSREKTAQLINLLCTDEENLPAVIGVDFMFVDEKDPKGDVALADALNNYGNVVFATNLVYRGELKESYNQLYFDTQNISMVEFPFEAIRDKSYNGYTSMIASDDGMVRYTSSSVNIEGKPYESFDYKIYSIYSEDKNRSKYVPKTNSDGQFEFFFSGDVGEFSHLSMCEVLEGNINPERFKDSIVLIGAYAPGFQDSYLVGADRGNPMHGVEIHANIIQALLEQKTANDAPTALMGMIILVVFLAFMLFGEKNRLSVTMISSAVVAIIYTIVAYLLSGKGITIPLLYIWAGMVIVDVYFVIKKYAVEKMRRKRTLAVFKKYVAPQVVDELSGKGNFEIRLGGENRDIAVLFVDIRGFTPLSEGLEPEQVVGILNEYLAHTTACIFKHGGTLDKFIGDATMAVFNAPFDLDDYVFAAVATAWDIAKGGEEMQTKLEAEYGKKVNFGVGVNCGPAVVGNIGCDFRMDYTAIGDTVNTAARLESNAKAGQVLISDMVYEKVKARVKAQSIGPIPLKGKSAKVEVYEVISINEG